jgi:hypothetical protein
VVGADPDGADGAVPMVEASTGLGVGSEIPDLGTGVAGFCVTVSGKAFGGTNLGKPLVASGTEDDWNVPLDSGNSPALSGCIRHPLIFIVSPVSRLVAVPIPVLRFIFITAYSPVWRF